MKRLLLVFGTLMFCVLATFPLLFMRNASAQIIVNNNENVKPGTIFLLASSNVPDGYLLCDGRAVSRDKYALLFSVIGVQAGSGDGSTTFNLPNMQGRTVVGKNAGTFNQIGKTGGEEKHVLSTKEIASHNHSVSSGTVSTKELKGQIWNLVYQEKDCMGAASGVIKKGVGWLEGEAYGGGSYYSGNDAIEINATHNHTLSGNTSSIGNSEGHNNLQPSITLNYIIKY